jgi:hypothetical protein
MYLAIDPGKRTGFARFNEKGELSEPPFVKTPEDNALDYLEEVDGVKEIIIETYRNRPGSVNSWSTGPTQQHIGAIQRIARKRRWKIHEQEPSPCLNIGLRFLGMANTYKGKHVPDEVSALAHGEYYLRKAKVK